MHLFSSLVTQFSKFYQTFLLILITKYSWVQWEGVDEGAGVWEKENLLPVTFRQTNPICCSSLARLRLSVGESQPGSEQLGAVASRPGTSHLFICEGGWLEMESYDIFRTNQKNGLARRLAKWMREISELKSKRSSRLISALTSEFPPSGGLRESTGEGEPWAGLHPHDSEEVPCPSLLCQHLATSVSSTLQRRCNNMYLVHLRWLPFRGPCHKYICTATPQHLLIHMTYYSGIFFIRQEM